MVPLEVFIMKTIAVLIIAALLFAVPNVTASQEVGSGHIIAGSPHTLVYEDRHAGVSSFILSLDGFANATLSTTTVDNGGLDYEINLYIYDASDDLIAFCPSEGGDVTTCPVPVAATSVEVAASYGVDLDVTVTGW